LLLHSYFGWLNACVLNDAILPVHTGDAALNPT
jgi:hypothetical protein